MDARQPFIGSVTDVRRSSDHGRRILYVLPLFAVLAATMVAAQTSDRARTELQAQRASERLVALQREAESLAAQERTLLVDLRRLEVERDLKTAQLKKVEAEAAGVSRDLGNITNQIDELEAQETAARPVLEARMVELYKLGGAGYVRLLFNVAELKEFGRAYRMVSSLSAIDRQRAIQHQETLNRLRIARSSLVDRKAQLTKLQRQAENTREAAARAAAARAQLVAQIDSRRDLTAELANELRAAQQRLQQTLAGMKAGVPQPIVEGSALPIKPFRGDLDWPVAGRVLTQFGRRADRVSSTIVQNGVQIAVQEGTAVQAVHDGTIAFNGPFSGYGNLVIVDHGGNVYSLYAQLEASQAVRGTHVDRGQTIGTSGRVLAGIPGIYFEIRVDGQPVDPLEWLKKRP